MIVGQVREAGDIVGVLEIMGYEYAQYQNVHQEHKLSGLCEFQIEPIFPNWVCFSFMMVGLVELD